MFIYVFMHAHFVCYVFMYICSCEHLHVIIVLNICKRYVYNVFVKDINESVYAFVFQK